MTWWESMILGVVQGLTEFFPVSSSGHLVITERLLGLSLPGIGFEVALHVATLVSVLIVYREKIWSLVLGCVGMREESAWPYVLKLGLASVPAAIVGLGFKDWFEARFEDPAFAGTMLLVTGAVVWSARWARGTTPMRRVQEWVPIGVAALVALLAGTLVPLLAVMGAQAVIMAFARFTAPGKEVPEPGWGGALMMGVAQSLAILPGISRSGSTVLAGLWGRIDPVAAAEFSFLMSIPAILGAAVLSLPELGQGQGEIGGVALLVGVLSAGIAGILAIRLFVELLRRRSFHVFAWYCWTAGACFLLYLRMGG